MSSNVIYLKTKDEIAKMKESGQILIKVFEAMQEAIKPGVSTKTLDTIARGIIEGEGARPGFLNYGEPPFPGTICASINEVVVHGIPSENDILRDGDIITIDVGAVLDGWNSDAARTYLVGNVRPEVRELVRVTEESFFKGLEYVRPGCRLGDVQAAIQNHIEKHCYGIVRELTGHGIGRDLHEAPDIPNYGKAGHGLRLQEGMVIAIEPMVTLGKRHVYVADDDWAIITVDGKPAAHYENSIAIMADGPMLLTK